MRSGGYIAARYAKNTVTAAPCVAMVRRRIGGRRWVRWYMRLSPDLGVAAGVEDHAATVDSERIGGSTRFGFCVTGWRAAAGVSASGSASQTS